MKSIEFISHVNLTFGPQGSYFCTLKDGGYFYRDIPSTLVSKIESASSRPRQVALGRHSAWVVIWEDNTFSYDLGAHYPDLVQMLKQYEKIAFVALNPYDDDSHFLVNCDGQTSFTFEGLTNEQAETIREHTLGYLQRRSRRLGKEFNRTQTREGIETKIKITPQTNWDQPATAISQPAKYLSEVRNNLGVENRLRVPQRIRETDVVAGCTAGISTALMSKLYGLRVGKALNVGLTAGAFTFAAVALGSQKR